MEIKSEQFRLSLILILSGRLTLHFNKYFYLIKFNKNLTKPPKYHYNGDRFLQIQHTRLRTNCNVLNEHLFSKNIISDPNCACGAIESTKHFFFECQRYNRIRTVMLINSARYCVPNVSNILFGVANMDYQTNCQILASVFTFIQDSQRF